MKTTTNTSSLTNYTLVNDTIQLRLNFNTEIDIQDDVKLRLVKNIIERMNLSKLKKVYSSFGRKPTVNPVTMLQIIISFYSEGIFSSIGIEKACKYDLRIKYFLAIQNYICWHRLLSLFHLYRYLIGLSDFLLSVFELFDLVNLVLVLQFFV